jgi:hypothetical protein
MPVDDYRLAHHRVLADRENARKDQNKKFQPVHVALKLLGFNRRDRLFSEPTFLNAT